MWRPSQCLLRGVSRLVCLFLGLGKSVVFCESGGNGDAEEFNSISPVTDNDVGF